MLTVAPLKQKFLPENLVIDTWDDVERYARDLLDRPIDDMAAYQRFLEDESELSAVIGEDYAWRYIRVTCRTDDEALERRLNDFLQNISPKLAELGDALNRKIAGSPFALEVPDTGFSIVLKKLQADINLFRTENIPLSIRDEELGVESGKIRGSMTVTLDGEEMPLPKAADRLFWPDRAKREEAWRAMRGRYYQDKDALDKNYDEVVGLRDQRARNAGFDNFRDYSFVSMKRFDYMPENCLVFHKAIEHAVVPLVEKMHREQARGLGLDKLRPWDVSVDAKGRPALKAFASADDMIDKSLVMYGELDSVFHDTVALMRKMGRLDLASRAHKQPGGYMMPLNASNVPFIFANVTEKVDDLTTFVHEVGHAVHGILLRDMRLDAFRSYPMEVAELASMAMELLTMDRWHHFFPDERDYRRAKREHLEGIIGFFPWMARVDAFQHEIYLNPGATPEQRHDIWTAIDRRFSTGMVDWSGFEDWERTNWHRQGHIFELPFYYIEYGIAQLGALQVWRNYKQDAKQAVAQYKNALALGYTKTIPEIYETAGIKFDFSVTMLTELMRFVQDELDALAN